MPNPLPERVWHARLIQSMQQLFELRFWRPLTR